MSRQGQADLGTLTGDMAVKVGVTGGRDSNTLQAVGAMAAEAMAVLTLRHRQAMAVLPAVQADPRMIRALLTTVHKPMRRISRGMAQETAVSIVRRPQATINRRVEAEGTAITTGTNSKPMMGGARTIHLHRRHRGPRLMPPHQLEEEAATMAATLVQGHMVRVLHRWHHQRHNIIKVATAMLRLAQLPAAMGPRVAMAMADQRARRRRNYRGRPPPQVVRIPVVAMSVARSRGESSGCLVVDAGLKGRWRVGMKTAETRGVVVRLLPSAATDIREDKRLVDRLRLVDRNCQISKSTAAICRAAPSDPVCQKAVGGSFACKDPWQHVTEISCFLFNLSRFLAQCSL